MYLSHFQFTHQPFRDMTRRTGDFLVPYHQDVFGLLKEKTKTPGIIGFFSAEAGLQEQFLQQLIDTTPSVLSINAFPKLSASALLYKLNPGAKETKNRLHAIDAVLRQWHEEKPSSRKTGKVLILSTAQAIKDNCWEVLGMLLSRAEELSFPLTIVLAGTPDQEARLLNHSGLSSRVHTRHTLRPLTCREYLSYVQAQMDEQKVETSPLAAPQIRKMHALTKGCISKLNPLAHLALLAAWTERSPKVTARHLRLAAGEILPRKTRGKRLATVGLFTSVLFAACGWYFSAAITARLPVELPIPVTWKKVIPKVQEPVTAQIGNEIVNESGAMHQLYTMWGYDTSTDQALCQNAGKVNLSCRQGNAPLQTLENIGYPWISEIHTGNRLNYAVIARVDKNSLDLLLNNRTWQVSRSWFNQHATGNYTLLHRLTPQGKDEISASSGRQDLEWLDNQLAQAENEPVSHSASWTAELEKRTKNFQQQQGLHVDGIAGEDTLMQLMRATGSTPSVTGPTSAPKAQEKNK